MVTLGPVNMSPPPTKSVDLGAGYLNLPVAHQPVRIVEKYLGLGMTL